MDTKIKIQEVDISNDDQMKITWLGDYWLEKQITKFFDLLKEYQDVFSQNYKDWKVLIKEKEEMKINLILGANQ